MLEQENTEEKILNAARKVFTSKGYAAARMDDIAKEAGMNRALIHYYFRSKDKMFQIIFEEKFRIFFLSISSVLTSDNDVKEKVVNLIRMYFEQLIENPDLPLFIINAVNASPENFIKLTNKLNVSPKEAFKSFHIQVQKEVEEGKIRNIKPYVLILNILSLSIFPFIARKMFMNINNISETEYFEILENRIEDVINMVLNDLIIDNNKLKDSK
ncbi:MAG: TetR/AcrR family transcriptional regulator [Candidatus Kapabacteria bacterium]|nr:TetR/AcrR family transcriptional regulator [Candidatus Kapabacteria bacterium]